VAEAKTALEKKFVFVHIKTPDLQILIDGLEAAQAKVHEYERQGGTINLLRSNKTRYARALARANNRLAELGQKSEKY
jgi:hypothetical protein